MLAKRIVAGVARLDAIQSSLRGLGTLPRGFQLLNSLSGTTRVYASYSDAERVARASEPNAHGHEPLIAMNLALSEARRPSDYPAMLWLQSIASQSKLRVVDFGGGAGQSYYQYRSVLGDAAIERWLVLDLPEVLEYGRRTAAERGTSGVLAFERSVPEDFGANVLFAAGSLHYWQEPLAKLASITGPLPEHVLINRSPLRERGDTFATIQRAGGTPVPCIVRSVDALTSDLNALGYALCDSWVVPEKTLRFLLLPGYDASYRGAYFRRR